MVVSFRIAFAAFIASAAASSVADPGWHRRGEKVVAAEDADYWERFLQATESSILAPSASPAAPTFPITPPPTTRAPVPVPVTPAPVMVPVTPAPVMVPVTPAPVMVPVTPAPVMVPVTPAPVLVPATPAPVLVTMAPIPVPVPETPAPVVAGLPATPAPVVPATPAPVVPATPAPVLVTSSPTQSPVPVVPTAAPSFVCFLEASITCVDGNGVPCEDIVPPSADQPEACIVQALYTYRLENTWTQAIEVTKLLRTRDGQEEDLFERVQGANPLRPNDVVSIAETAEIDVCAGGFFSTTLVAAAVRESGNECETTASYDFELEGYCQIDITADCVTGDGTPCNELVGLDGTAGNASNCAVDVLWIFEATNIGSDNLNLTSISITRDGAVIDLSDQITVSELAPGQSSVATFEEVVDICVPSVLTTTASVEAEPSCSAEEVYEFEISISAPTAAPTTSNGIPGQPGSPTVPPVVATPSPTQPVDSSSVPSAPPGNGTDAPADDCELLLEIGCLPPFNGASCDEIPSITTECQTPASQMVMRYNGGDCSGSFNIQPDTLFQCVDNEGGPPTEVGASSYIVATSVDENPEEYFAGFVAVGDDFTLMASTEIANNTNIVIYDPNGSNDPAAIVASGAVLQTITFHTSCTNSLYLTDRFGSVQLVEFENSEQGLVSSSQKITLTFTIASVEEGATSLTSLTLISNLADSDSNTVDLSALVTGSEVTPSASVTVQQEFDIDLTQRKRYRALATIVGDSATGKTCTGRDDYRFTAGNPLPQIFPTATPTATPTVTPFPTPDPNEAACEVEASISCALANGQRCSLKSPMGSTCLGGNANFLQFIYVPSSLCMGNNTAANFQCEDFNLDITRPTDVYVSIRRGNENTWFSGVATEGQVIDVPITLGSQIRIEISTVDNGAPGTLLQESVMSTRCNDLSGLTLMSFFGHMELVGYQNAEMGLQQVFANVNITYTATNGGLLDMELFGAFGSSPFTGFQDFLEESTLTLSRDQSTSFVEQFTLNLGATAGDEYQFTFLAQGRGSISEVACDATAAYTLSVQ